MSLQQIADSGLSNVFIEEIEKLITSVADVRLPLNVQCTEENQVRKAVCDVLEERLLKPIKRQTGELPQVSDDYT